MIRSQVVLSSRGGADRTVRFSGKVLLAVTIRNNYLYSDRGVSDTSAARWSGGTRDRNLEQMQSDFEQEFESVLSDTEAALKEAPAVIDQTEMLTHARRVVSDFRPVSEVIWRLAHATLGKSGSIQAVSDGQVFGLKKLLIRTASDPCLGDGSTVSSSRAALKAVAPDVVAAVSVMYAFCRRLGNQDHQAIVAPLLEDGLLRSRLGFEAGAREPTFGSGRGMLAGFVGRAGMAIILSTGTREQAQAALTAMAGGQSLRALSRDIYRLDALFVSALLLSISGCGREAAYGILAADSDKLQLDPNASAESNCWMAAYALIEHLRSAKSEQVPPFIWETLGFHALEDQEVMLGACKKVLRRGHGWHWLKGLS